LRDYELVVVLAPNLTREEAESSWERIKQQVVQRGGTITHEEQWGIKKLAYPIRRGGQKHMEGNYLLARLRIAPSETRGLEDQLRLAEEVLRFLLVKWEAPQPVTTGAEG
jgi:small subunit ribosomal protein S6